MTREKSLIAMEGRFSSTVSLDVSQRTEQTSTIISGGNYQLTFRTTPRILARLSQRSVTTS
jgi:hypothetical protein